MLGVVLGVHIPDMINDEAGSRNEEVVHPVEAPTDRLCVNSVMRDSSTGLINHLMNTDKKEVGVEHEPDKHYTECCWFQLI